MLVTSLLHLVSFLAYPINIDCNNRSQKQVTLESDTNGVAFAYRVDVYVTMQRKRSAHNRVLDRCDIANS